MNEETPEFDIEVTNGEEHTPELVTLLDNGVVIFDVTEFCEVFNCHAAQYTEGQLYVLDKDSGLWRNVEPDKKTKLSTIK